MSHIQRNLPVYRPQGNPAFAFVQFAQSGKAMPLVGDTITINGDVYTFGTDFFGQTPAMCLRSLVAAVRADQQDGGEINPTNTNFIRPYTAEFKGIYAVLYAVVPGTPGNALTLATSAATRITVSGATFTGGSEGVDASGGNMTDGSGTIAAGDASQQVFAANPTRQYLFVQNQSAESLWINFGIAAVKSQPSIQLLASGGSMVWEGDFVPTGILNIIGHTTGDVFTAKQA